MNEESSGITREGLEWMTKIVELIRKGAEWMRKIVERK